MTVFAITVHKNLYVGFVLGVNTLNVLVGCFLWLPLGQLGEGWGFVQAEFGLLPVFGALL